MRDKISSKTGSRKINTAEILVFKKQKVKELNTSGPVRATTI